MKTKYNSLGLATLVSTFLMAAPAHAATLLLDDVEARRVQDTNLDGLGDTTALDVLDVGNYGTGDRTHPVFVFRMTGKNPSHIVTTADFTVTQTRPAGTNTPTFDVVAHVIRTSASSTILVSDFENTAQSLMPNFDNGNQNGGTVSLDSVAEMTLGTYLNTNWVEGNYVFITLKNTTYTTATFFELLRYGNSSTSWAASSTTAQLNVTTTIPEPSAALLGGLGMLALLRRRR